MREDVVAAEGAKEVRDAARGWRTSGFINDQVLSRIVALYPDDRQRFGPGFRALAFVFTGIAVLAVVGLSLVLFEPQRSGGAGLLLFWAAALAGLTELQRGPLKRADAGAESATGLAAVLLGVLGVALGIEDNPSDATLTVFLASSVALCGAAAWRWGDSIFFLGTGCAAFGLLTRSDHGRLLWIVASLLLIPACLKAARTGELSPSHRRGVVILGGISILALYAAIHIWSWDKQGIESMRWVSSSAPETPGPAFVRPLSIVATALLPPAFLLMGWRRREPLLLYAGLLLIGASIATIRLYREVMPLSFALMLVGAACLALALGVRRWLRGGERGEQDGFTADPLFDRANRTDAIKSVVAMASFTPAAHAPSSQPAFRGEGGSFGGGGATGSF